MTQRLYYNDSSLLTFDAEIVRAEGDGTRVVLDRTAFYPTSGGQPHDLGTLNNIPVLDVFEDAQGNVVHVLARSMSAGGSAVAGRIDAARRRDHTQQHTAQHLLSAVLHDRYQRPTVSFHLGADDCTIDLDGLPLGAAQFAEIECHLFDAITADLSVTVATHESADRLTLRKPTDRTGPIRVVTIEGLDVNACGGTHVTSTGQLGLVLLLGVEKVKQGTRLRFVAGDRALAHARRSEEWLGQLAMTFGCSAPELPAMAMKQRDLVATADKAVRALTAELAVRDGRDRYLAASPDANGRRVLMLELTDAIDDRTRAMVQAFVSGGHAVACLTSRTSHTVLLSASADSGIDAGAVLKPLLTAAGGKGGGSAMQAQGSVPDDVALATVCAGVAQLLA